MSKYVNLVVVLCVGAVIGGISTYHLASSAQQVPSAISDEKPPTNRTDEPVTLATVSHPIAVQLPPEVIVALTAVESDDPGTAAKDHDKRVELVKSWLHQCRRNGCLPERVPLIKAYMARFQFSWEEVESSPQEIRDMWFQRSLELLGGARNGSRWHLHAFRGYIAAAPAYVTLESLGTSQTELDQMEQEFVRKYGS